MRRIFSLISCIMFFCYIPFSHAQVYKWRDENGKLHFSSVPPELGPEVKKVKLNTPPADRNNARRQRQLLIKQQYELDAKKRKKERLLNKQLEQLSEEETAQKQQEELKAFAHKQCSKYTQRYNKYRRKGVKVVNSTTGAVEKADTRTARKIIQDTKESRDLFCETAEE